MVEKMISFQEKHTIFEKKAIKDISMLGWTLERDTQFAEFYENGFIPARIASEYRNRYTVFCKKGAIEATLNDKLWYNTFSKIELPAVGDWVALKFNDDTTAQIVSILPRKSKFSRKCIRTFGWNYTKAGTSELQVISANIDWVFLVLAPDRDFNLRRIERYLVLMWDSGAQPVIILNKCDLVLDEKEKLLSLLAEVAIDVPIHLISAKTHQGISELYTYLQKGQTITFIGSSGAGKSTIINVLLGYERQKVMTIRDQDFRGRHTTSTREMILFPDGGICIDNPGIKDIQIINSRHGLNQTFRDIIALAQTCRFRNCTHQTEPDCAVQNAIAEGTLDENRLESYRQLSQELIIIEQREHEREKFIEKAKFHQKKKNMKYKKHKHKKRK